ncbi:MAG: hypothetical protein EZS26_000018 [Candidatus Ordinivivax streblomastigis]|uniref:Lipoprotein n=1 Tax=Candidatus Ordinivivax streblomastigis TaxID=2540710 RepID=A0A5M8P4M7_9BACT|nr:MAG: hypothetical protein EZS26_000018 [Candidatus Ordinivivax streblomastigis]
MKMIRRFFCLNMVFLFFVACDPPDPPVKQIPFTPMTILATIENGQKYASIVDSVQIAMELNLPAEQIAQETNREDKKVVVITAPYTGSDFEIVLPIPVKSECLFTLFYGMPEGIEIEGDADVYGMAFWEVEAVKDGNIVGYFYQSKTDDQDKAWLYDAAYAFVVKSVTVEGECAITEKNKNTGKITTNEYNYNCTLKKGWNVMYRRTKNILTDGVPGIRVEYFTEKLSGVQWYFDPK